jgi:Transposase DDE domain
MIPAVFEPFLEQAPFCVLTRLTLENLFDPQRLDALFQQTAQRQYHKELLFSQVVELMLAVVLRLHPSVLDGYRQRQDSLAVSDQAVYDKLRRLETAVAAALVADSAAQIVPVLEALPARRPPYLPGYRCRVLDGSHLGATQRRLKPLRRTKAAALPGTVIALYEPELDLVTQVLLTPDGHAQERSLLDELLPCVQAKDLWIADRNFCTCKFLFGIAASGAAFVIRHHGQLAGSGRGRRRWRGRSATGRVYEQEMVLEYQDQPLTLRRITVALDQPTQDGDAEIHILTNLPASVDAACVAELYHRRWTIERRFYEVTQTLNCEPNTLAYPQAALFAFCLALVASNAVALMKAALSAEHEPEAVAELSSYYLALEVQQTYHGMMIALPPACWLPFAGLRATALAEVLREVARRVDPCHYRKAKRGPKKPPPSKDAYRNGGHVATYRLLQKRQKQ